MQLSLKSSALVAFLVAQAAEGLPAYANESIEANLVQENSSSRHKEVSNLISRCNDQESELLKLDGSYTRYTLGSLHNKTFIDARQAIWKSDMRRNSAAVRLNGVEDLCWVGGRIQADRALHRASSRISNYVGMAIRTAHSPFATITVNNVDISGIVNGMHVIGPVDTLILQDVEMSDMDMGGTCVNVESFQVMDVRNSLFDGCDRLFDWNESLQETGRQLVIEGNVIRIKRDKTNNERSTEYGIFDSTRTISESISINLYDNVILFENDVDPAYVWDQLFGGIVECANNLFIFRKKSLYRFHHSDCGTITYDIGIWEEAKLVWRERHSGGTSDSDLHSASPNGTVDSVIARVRAHSVDSVTSRVREGVDGTRVNQSFHVLDAISELDVVAEGRMSIEQAISHAEERATAVASFLGRWADGSFWDDGTGWLE